MDKSLYPTLQQIRAAHSWKRDYERYLPVSRFLFRPVGFLVTWLAIRAGLTSEAVSWLSGVVGLAACFCLFSGRTGFLFAGVMLLFLFNLLDCVDGSIARTMKTQNPYGRFLDSLMGWVDMVFGAVIGVAAWRHPELLLWPSPFNHGSAVWMVVGVITSFLFIYAAYVENIFDELLREPWFAAQPGMRPEDGPYKAPGITWRGKALRMTVHNLRVRETQYLLLLLAYLSKSLDLLLGFYLFFNALHVLSLLIIYNNRGRQVYKNSNTGDLL